MTLCHSYFSYFSYNSTDSINYVDSYANDTSSHFSNATTKIVDVTKNTVRNVPVTNLIVK